MRQYSGFTLVELLVVCAILAVISYVAWGAYIGVDRRVEDELARTELMRMATALRRFHNDTGYWPGEGPFRPYDSGSPGDGALVGLPSATWFASPANLFLLFERPNLFDEHPLAHLEDWNADTHRGWNGPYLPLAVRHWVDVGSNMDNPAQGNPIIKDVPAFGAGPRFPPVCGSGCPLSWRVLPSSGVLGYVPDRHELQTHARPFLFLRDHATPRVVYWGADGRYGGANDSAPCLPNADDPDGKDDVVICL